MMKFSIQLGKEHIGSTMRGVGYAPEGQDEKTGQLKFYRALRGAKYPRFHIYCSLSAAKDSVLINLHLDQKQPSYQGSHAHSGEYDGALVEEESARIQDVIG